MSDPNVAREAPDLVPWAIAALTATWGLIIRVTLGRQFKHNDQTASDISEIRERLAAIEGHLGVANEHNYDNPGSGRRRHPR